MGVNPTDVRFVIVAPDGTWLGARIGERTPMLSSEETRELQNEVAAKGGLAAETVVIQAANPRGAPPPSKNFPWIPIWAKGKTKKKRKKTG